MKNFRQTHYRYSVPGKMNTDGLKKEWFSQTSGSRVVKAYQ